jgi:hypothetical protein
MNLTPNDILVLVQSIISAYQTWLYDILVDAYQKGNKEKASVILKQLNTVTPSLQHVNHIKSIAQLTDEDLTILVTGINDPKVVQIAIRNVMELDPPDNDNIIQIPTTKLRPFIKERMLGYINTLKEFDKETNTREQQDITGI